MWGWKVFFCLVVFKWEKDCLDAALGSDMKIMGLDISMEYNTRRRKREGKCLKCVVSLSCPFVSAVNFLFGIKEATWQWLPVLHFRVLLWNHSIFMPCHCQKGSTWAWIVQWFTTLSSFMIHEFRPAL